MFLMLQKSKNHLPKKILGRSFCMALLLSMPLSQATEKQKQKLEATESTIAEFQQTGQLPTPELIEKQKEEAERFLCLENAKKSAEAEKKRMVEKYEKDIKRKRK